MFGLRVPEVTSASIKGLQGLKFVDKTVEGTPTLEEAREEVSWSAYMSYSYIAMAIVHVTCVLGMSSH